MGLSEQLRDGAILERKVIPFSGTTIHSASFGPAYVILDIEVDNPCRIRFYDDESSLLDIVEETRSFGESTFTTDIGLIADVSMSVAGKYTMDPVLYGAPSGSEEFFTYFRITESVGEIQGNLTIYPLEDPSIPADIDNPFYKLPNRRTLTFEGPRDTLTGALDGAVRTYLLIDATSSENCRLRIYSNESSLNTQTEIDRPFDEPITSSDIKLVADMVLEDSEITKFYPKIVGANLQTMPQNLETIRTNLTAIKSFSDIYYRIEPSTANVEVTIFALED
jgi:hypothetical protein